MTHPPDGAIGGAQPVRAARTDDVADCRDVNVVVGLPGVWTVDGLLVDQHEVAQLPRLLLVRAGGADSTNTSCCDDSLDKKLTARCKEHKFLESTRASQPRGKKAMSKWILTPVQRQLPLAEP